MPEESFSIVCLSSQPWSVDLPTNRQHIMLQAARRGHRVLFVETGSFLGVHLWRLVSRPRRGSLARRLVATESASEGVRVRKALNVLPWGHKYGLANRINWAVTSAVLRPFVRRLPSPVVLWIYDPLGAACSCGEAFAVYDCVDDYPEQAGSDRRRRELAVRGDRRAAERSQLVFATARPLLERHRRVNSQTHLVRNVADYAHFAPAADRSSADADARGLRRPVVGFAGNFSVSKVDLGLLEAIARERPDWTLLLVGPARDGMLAKLAVLAAETNVSWVGAKPYHDLPAYIAAFDVGLIPYRTNEYTRSCFPIKLYEYLAAGKPVVATGVPELAGMGPDVALVPGDAKAVVAAVEEALTRVGDDDRKRRMTLAAANTWDTRAGRLLGYVSDELANV